MINHRCVISWLGTLGFLLAVSAACAQKVSYDPLALPHGLKGRLDHQGLTPESRYSHSRLSPGARITFAGYTFQPRAGWFSRELRILG